MKEAIIGLVVGMVTAATGVGGSMLTVPALMLLCSTPAVQAVGTAFAFATLIRSLAVAEYARRGQIDWDAARRMLLGAAPGVALGTVLLARLACGGTSHTACLLIGLTVSYVAAVSLARRWFPAPRPMRENRRQLGCLALPIGLQVGFTSVGAGALGSLVLLTRTHLAPATVVGTVLVFGLGLSVLGSGLHIAAGHCDFPLLISLSLGGVPGVLAGSWIAVRVPSWRMRVALLLLLALAGGHISWQGVQGMLGTR